MSNPFAESAVPADWCIHAANLCYLASYLGRDMLWLRILTCCGLTLGIVFFTCGSVPMFGPTAWQAAFLLINVVQIGRLLRHRENVRLTGERAAAAKAFSHLSREDLADLLARSARPDGDAVLAEVAAGGDLPPDDDEDETDGDPAGDLDGADDGLTDDERALRDMAFGGLSKGELLNLVTRRFGDSVQGTLYHLTPSRLRAWSRRRARLRRQKRRRRRVARRAAMTNGRR